MQTCFKFSDKGTPKKEKYRDKTIRFHLKKLFKIAHGYRLNFPLAEESSWTIFQEFETSKNNTYQKIYSITTSQ